MDDGFEDFFYLSADGLRLHARIYQAEQPDAVPVVCLPGLTRNARDFHDLALTLSGNANGPRQVICFDYRGRGESQRDPDPTHYAVPTEAADILEGLKQLQVTRAAFIGTSRGGLILHLIAATTPSVIACAVLNDVGPELGIDGLAQIKDYLSRPQTVRSFEEAEAMLREIHGAAFPDLHAADWRRMTRAVYREEDGALVPDCDPAIARSFASLDLTTPLPALWDQFAAFRQTPMLVIRGANSQLLTNDIVIRMRAAHADLEMLEVPGQGHPPMLETGTLPATVGAFIDRNS
jgi:pimeloyl-ACP methyl ester carboxylesterase